MAGADAVIEQEYPRRIGWECWAQPPPNPFPREDNPPQLVYPPSPDFAAIAANSARYRKWGQQTLVVAGFLVFGGFAGAGAAALFIGLLVGAVGIGLLTQESREIAQRRSQHAAARSKAEQSYHAALTEWEAQKARWYAKENARIQAIPTHYLVNLQDPRRRLDVVGGLPAGWACLLNTMSRPLVDRGVGITVLDFSEASVAIELGVYAARAGRRVQQCLLPDDLDRVNLLKGLGPDEVAEVLVATAHAVRDRKGREDEEQRELDTAVIAAVCRVLHDRGITIQRILSGLDVVNQAARTKSGDLSAEERTALEENTYLSVISNRLRDRYAQLRPRLERLASMSATDSIDVARLPRDGDVSILSIEGSTHRETSQLANLVVQCVLQRARLERAEVTANLPIVAIVGADVLTAETVRSLSRRAARNGVRTAFLFGNLEGDAWDLIGADGSETIFLQLQHPEQAQRAADFIGKGHRFVLGQITKSVGDALGGSRGGNRSFTHTSSEARGEGASYGFFVPNSKNWSFTQTESYARMEGTQWSDTWQKTDTYGETATRVYEYDVEPRRLQELDVNAFVYVTRAGAGTRVVGGDCNPGLEDAPLTAPYPREEHPVRGGPSSDEAGPQPEPHEGEVTDVKVHAFGIEWGRDEHGRTVYREMGEPNWSLFDPTTSSLVPPAGY